LLLGLHSQIGEPLDDVPNDREVQQCIGTLHTDCVDPVYNRENYVIDEGIDATETFCNFREKFTHDNERENRPDGEFGEMESETGLGVGRRNRDIVDGLFYVRKTLLDNFGFFANVRLLHNGGDIGDFGLADLFFTSRDDPGFVQELAVGSRCDSHGKSSLNYKIEITSFFFSFFYVFYNSTYVLRIYFIYRIKEIMKLRILIILYHKCLHKSTFTFVLILLL